jgi:hypothetical protein
MVRMKSVRPLREASEDIAREISVILEGEIQSWDVRLVQKSLHCYRAWVDYAVHVEEVKFEVLFSYKTQGNGATNSSALSETMNRNVGRVFGHFRTIYPAADVYGDIAEWGSLSKSVERNLKELFATDIVQGSYRSYAVGAIGLDSSSSIGLLAIRLAETEAEKLLEDLSPINSKLLDIMLFLLSSELSSRTFTFWISFAEASVDVGDGGQGEPWLRSSLALLLEKATWTQETDEDEWMGYRTDVVEVFEVICEAMGFETVNSVVTTWLDNATTSENSTEKLVVPQPIEEICL